ncbi:MAG: YidC/Oxa1 family insertase periplasmic-domain containing protein, partial [Paramuribaculum sp.]|nr:YidC/Oxa1 family insertase periplasmic-domain containing protein [Paramuribaculum sp.]
MNKQNSSGSPMTAMLLMGAVILLFMWLNRPKHQDIQLTDELNAPVEQTVATVGADSLTPAQIADIVNVVRQNGRFDSASTTFSLAVEGGSLKVDASGKISGEFSVPALPAPVSVAELTNGRHPSLSPRQAATAVELLMSSVNHAARYRGFARYTRGDSSTIRLENSKLALEISNKGGVISRATLKDYQAFDSSAVEMISPKRGGYSFTLTTATQRFETSEFYFEASQLSDTTVLMSLNLGDGASWGLLYTLIPDSYLVRMDVVQQNMQSVLPPSTAEMDF